MVGRMYVSSGQADQVARQSRGLCEEDPSFLKLFSRKGRVPVNSGLFDLVEISRLDITGSSPLPLYYLGVGDAMKRKLSPFQDLW
jgi:hypothetical protein